MVIGGDELKVRIVEIRIKVCILKIAKRGIIISNLSLASDEIYVSKRLIEFRLFAEVRDTRECGDKSRDSPIESLHVKFY